MGYRRSDSSFKFKRGESWYARSGNEGSIARRLLSIFQCCFFVEWTKQKLRKIEAWFLLSWPNCSHRRAQFFSENSNDGFSTKTYRVVKPTLVSCTHRSSEHPALVVGDRTYRILMTQTVPTKNLKFPNLAWRRWSLLFKEFTLGKCNWAISTTSTRHNTIIPILMTGKASY